MGAGGVPFQSDWKYLDCGFGRSMAEGQLLLLHDSFFLRCQECGDHLTFPFLRLLGRIFVSSASGSGNRDNDDDNATLQYRSQYCNVVHGSMHARSRARWLSKSTPLHPLASAATGFICWWRRTRIFHSFHFSPSSSCLKAPKASLSLTGLGSGSLVWKDEDRRRRRRRLR